MSDTQNKKISPIVAIAAGSVILFSAVGIGVMTGIIPNSLSKPEQAPKVEEAMTVTAPAPTMTPAAKPAPAEQPKAAVAQRQRTEPARVASAERARVAQVCGSCGSVISVNAIKHQGEGSGLGAVAGGVVGGVLGNQVGGGRGRTAATVVGAGAGAYAGHQIEKRAKSTESYSVAVRMDDGSTRSFNYENEPAFRAGDKVKVVEGMLVAN